MQGSPHTTEGAGSSSRHTAAELLPLVYDELRRMAAYRLAQEEPGQTLEPTALVHEAWLRLVRHEDRPWIDAKEFFLAAARAMTRILIDNARRKHRVKHGGLLERVELTDRALATPMRSEELLALDEALDHLSLQEPQAALLVQLRYFAGLGHQEAAELLGISRRTADGLWACARAWLLTELRRQPGNSKLSFRPRRRAALQQTDLATP
jgi:RNA polymerase sigma factor (TIGR02999 family)